MNDDTLEALQVANGLAPSPVADEGIPLRKLGRGEGLTAAIEALAFGNYLGASAWLRSPNGQAAVKEYLQLLDKALPDGK